MMPVAPRSPTIGTRNSAYLLCETQPPNATITASPSTTGPVDLASPRYPSSQPNPHAKPTKTSGAATHGRETL